MSRGLALVSVATLLALLPTSAQADEVLGPTGFITDFPGFDGSGFAPEPAEGQLDSDDWIATGFSDGPLDFGGTATTGDFARGVSEGGLTQGGLYAFDPGNDLSTFALGAQPTGADFAPGAFVLRLENGAGGVLNRVEISSSVFVYNDEGRSSSIVVEVSSDGMTWLPTGVGVETPADEDAEPMWVGADLVDTGDMLAVGPGEFLYVRWLVDDVGGAGMRDEIAIDDIFIEPIAVCGSVEKAHSSTSDMSRILEYVADQGLPVGPRARLDSQAKYAVVGRGQADAYLRLPTRKDYVERIWDHAAGSLIAQEGGAAVSDIHGKALDFGQGKGLAKNKGVVCARPRLHGIVLEAIESLGIGS
ncbi:MAG: inositol monophosphatase family protein [Myxococcota bacterium]